MELDEGLLKLVSPLKVGEAITPGVHLVGVSHDLGLRLTFEVEGSLVHIELSPAEEGRKFAVRTPRLFLAYRSPPQRPVSAPVGLALCRAVAARVVRHEDEVLDAFAARAARAASKEEGSARIREVFVARFLEAGADAQHRMYTANPYVGCLVGCRFCYAQSRTAVTRQLGQLPALPWGSYTDVKMNAGEVLAHELKSLPEGPIKFCPIVSDAYQPVERRYRITRQCLEAIAASGRNFPPLILTRTEHILEDAALLASISGAHAGASIPTFDDEVRKHFEPRAITIEARFAMLHALRKQGVKTFAVVQPMLPGSVDALAQALADAVDSVSIEVLYGVEGAEREFADKRYLPVREQAWQAARLEALREALAKRNVPVWTGDLPPALTMESTTHRS